MIASSPTFDLDSRGVVWRPPSRGLQASGGGPPLCFVNEHDCDEFVNHDLDIDDSDSMDVAFRGDVDLLCLRGGGGDDRPREDDGRGVAAWLDADSSDDDARPPREAIHCGVCGAYPPTDNWAWCACRLFQCEDCLSRPCGVCARAVIEEPLDHSLGQQAEVIDFEVEPQHHGDEPPVVIYLADHVDDPDDDYARLLEDNIVNAPGWNSEPAGDEAPNHPHLLTQRAPTTWTITGFRDGVRVRVCQHCARDRPQEGHSWTLCGCGTSLCEDCTRTGCSRCRRPTPSDGASNPAALQDARPPEAHALDQEQDAYPFSSTEYSWLEDEHDSVGAHVILSADGDVCAEPVVGSRVGRCPRCMRWLGEWGVSWRICACGIGTCTDCVGMPCVACGCPTVFGPPREHIPPAERERVTPAHEFDGEGDRDYSHQGAAAALANPPAVSPEEAHRQRVKQIEDAKEDQRRRRSVSRRLRSEHVLRGLRPGRSPRGARRVSIVTANITAASSLLDELRHGSSLVRDDYLLVQELACAPEGCEMLARDVTDLGYALALHRAYFKEGGYGGGVAILAKGEGGVRPLPASAHEGRCLLGIIDPGIEITCATVYGISGAPAKKQLELWRDLASRIRCLGRPFIIGGDWQVDPQEVAKARLDVHLDATILSASTPTNRVTGTRIDFFLVSNCLVTDGVRAEVVEGCRFSPPCACTYHVGSFRPHPACAQALWTEGASGRQARWAAAPCANGRLGRLV